MAELKIGIIREGKVPVDNRAPLTPEQAARLRRLFPGVEVFCQTSAIRCFSDQEYEAKGIEATDDLTPCDLLLGIKEPRVEDLLADKTYMFFSHTIKKQPYNRTLLQKILEKNIRLIDYECLKDAEGARTLAFGRYAGIVGAYNGIYAYYMKHNLGSLKRAKDCFDYDELKNEFKKIRLPPIKIVLTGSGRVGTGARETLENLSIRRVWPKDFFREYNEPVYVQLFSRDYYRRIDNAKFNYREFISQPELYKSTFSRFLSHTDLLIVGSYWDPRGDRLFTREEMLSDDFRIKVIADISCDINGPIPSTKRASTIDEPIYDYDPEQDQTAAPFSDDRHIAVMAVDNLPSELPRDSSADFGNDLLTKVLPFVLRKDNGMIERATIAENGRLTPYYQYLQDYVEGRE